MQAVGGNVHGLASAKHEVFVTALHRQLAVQNHVGFVPRVGMWRRTGVDGRTYVEDLEGCAVDKRTELLAEHMQRGHAVQADRSGSGGHGPPPRFDCRFPATKYYPTTELIARLMQRIRYATGREPGSGWPEWDASRWSEGRRSGSLLTLC